MNPKQDDAYGPKAVDLACHPGSSCPAVRRIQARASLLEAGVLSLGFTVTGTLDELALPPVGNPERTDRLWEHTCFEAFLSKPGDERYFELNVAPSTAWAAYAFQRYREGGSPAEGLDPRVVVHRSPGRLELHALLRLDRALALEPGHRLRLGLSAVIELRDGSLSYWAMKHPEGRPDFHHPLTFDLELVAMPEEE